MMFLVDQNDLERVDSLVREHNRLTATHASPCAWRNFASRCTNLGNFVRSEALARTLFDLACDARERATP